MHPDDEPTPPPPASVPRQFIPQPSRRSRLGRHGRGAPERRIPGSSEPAEPPPEEETADAPGSPEPTRDASSAETDSRREEAAAAGEAADETAASRGDEDSGATTSLFYRPPARSAETLWGAEPPAPVTPARVFTRKPPRRSRFLRPGVLLLALGLAAGGALGYVLGRGSGPARGEPGSREWRPAPAPPADDALESLPPEILAAVVQDLDAAFVALKQGRFDEARASIQAAQDRRPPAAPDAAGTGWSTLEVERARVFFYAGDFGGAERALVSVLRGATVGNANAPATADAQLLRALVQAAQRNYGRSNELFAAAASADPARADIFFFWGNSLRRQGKPVESVPKFRSALLRNQFETMDGLIRLKLWLSQLQVDEQAAEAGAAIEAALAAQPTGYAWAGAAARAVREKRFPAVGAALAKARPLLEPVVFRVVLSDPTFSEQNWRPELAEFYK